MLLNVLAACLVSGGGMGAAEAVWDKGEKGCVQYGGESVRWRESRQDGAMERKGKRQS